MKIQVDVTEITISDQHLLFKPKVCMDNSFHRQDLDAQQKRNIFAGLQFFVSILPLTWYSINWLAGFIKLTEEEQEDAGIYLGRLGDK